MENASIVPVMDVNRGYGYGDGFVMVVTVAECGSCGLLFYLP